MPTFTRADIDGTKPGRACLVSIDLNKPGEPGGGPIYQEFTEADGYASPAESCQGLWRSIRDDFPAHRWVVVADERARFIVWRKDMIATLGDQGDDDLIIHYLALLNMKAASEPIIVT